MPYEVSVPTCVMPSIPPSSRFVRSLFACHVGMYLIHFPPWFPNSPALVLRGQYGMTSSLFLGNVDSPPHPSLLEFTVPL